MIDVHVFIWCKIRLLLKKHVIFVSCLSKTKIYQYVCILWTKHTNNLLKKIRRSHWWSHSQSHIWFVSFQWKLFNYNITTTTKILSFLYFLWTFNYALSCIMSKPQRDLQVSKRKKSKYKVNTYINNILLIYFLFFFCGKIKIAKLLGIFYFKHWHTLFHKYFKIQKC